MRRSTALWTLSLFAAVSAQAGEGLRLPSEPSSWQARVQLLHTNDVGGSHLLGANLLGDYYLGRRNAGLRVSGGLMVGPMALLGSGAGLALGPDSVNMGQRNLRSGTGDPSLRQPYLGVGYSSQGQAWRFSADLGVAMRGDGSGLSLRSGDAFAQGLGGLQLTPMLQMGLSYRF